MVIIGFFWMIKNVKTEFVTQLQNFFIKKKKSYLRGLPIAEHLYHLCHVIAHFLFDDVIRDSHDVMMKSEHEQMIRARTVFVQMPLNLYSDKHFDMLPCCRIAIEDWLEAPIHIIRSRGYWNPQATLALIHKSTHPNAATSMANNSPPLSGRSLLACCPTTLCASCYTDSVVAKEEQRAGDGSSGMALASRSFWIWLIFDRRAGHRRNWCKSTYRDRHRFLSSFSSSR